MQPCLILAEALVVHSHTPCTGVRPRVAVLRFKPLATAMGTLCPRTVAARGTRRTLHTDAHTAVPPLHPAIAGPQKVAHMNTGTVHPLPGITRLTPTRFMPAWPRVVPHWVLPSTSPPPIHIQSGGAMVLATKSGAPLGALCPLRTVVLGTHTAIKFNTMNIGTRRPPTIIALGKHPSFSLPALHLIVSTQAAWS
ncbi:hypothetical protein H0H81_005406 [Sphagnurus paluster]|uniref:Uncharacterized protein n=1 Tax=Sphagnurus paluster TaxID=117069 RepID=A0A9P7GKZ9_9AGAR|nr:hypothetical protein H0H81_005406 [Sphagnurus paluster]